MSGSFMSKSAFAPDSGGSIFKDNCVEANTHRLVNMYAIPAAKM